MQPRRSLFLAVPLLLTLAPGCRSNAVKERPTRSDQAAIPPGATAVTSDTPLVPPPPSEPTTAKPSPDVKMGPLSFAPVAKAADASVVTIYTVGEDDSRGGGPLGRRTRSRTAKGLGTGWVVQKDGVIVTNNHVIDGADEILVQLSDERRFPAKVAGRDARTDIAVVKVEGVGDLPTLNVGDSDGLEVGDWVVAIGNPFGLSHTVSAGIVSAKGRGRDDVPLDPSGYYNFIQTDASINPGNSGGPLLNLKGEVVGMNTAIRGGGAQGIGFAIPINMVKQLLPPLLRDGHVTRSALGIRITDVRDLTPEDKTKLKINGDNHNEKGAVVEFVEPNGPADKAKLESGDVITGFGGQNIERGSLLQWMASTAGVGKTVPVRAVRQGKTFDVNVTLGKLEEAKKTPRPRLPQPPDPDDDPFAR
jgi:serine protease Do